MLGFDAPYLPGWDCHGLPIELKVDRELGPKKRQMSTADFRRACRAYAEKYVDIQRHGFKRLGIIGLWDDPYKTMAFRYQASIVRALGKFVDQDMVYKGKKPVHWCTHCRTALAEAEVEYEPHTSPSIYVEFPLADRSADELARRLPALAGRRVSVLIWTTTPWTIPSNLAIAFHPEFRYAAYDVDGTAVIVARDLGRRGGAKTGAGLRRAARRVRRHGDGASGVPPSALRSRLARRARRLRHARGRHRRGPHRAGSRSGRLQDRREVRAGDSGPARRWRPLRRDGRALQRPAGVRRESQGGGGAEGSRPAVAPRGLRPLLSALLALSQPGDFSRDRAVVHRHGLEGPARAGAAGDPRAECAGSRPGARHVSKG